MKGGSSMKTIILYVFLLLRWEPPKEAEVKEKVVENESVEEEGIVDISLFDD